MIPDLAFALFLMLISTSLLPINSYRTYRAKQGEKAQRIGIQP